MEFLLAVDLIVVPFSIATLWWRILRIISFLLRMLERVFSIFMLKQRVVLCDMLLLEENPRDIINRVHEAGMLCGITVKPKTPVSAILEYIPLV